MALDIIEESYLRLIERAARYGDNDRAQEFAVRLEEYRNQFKVKQ